MSKELATVLIIINLKNNIRLIQFEKEINWKDFMNNNELSTVNLISRGYLLVNIPSMLIIIAVWFGLTAYMEINGKISAIIGGAMGWVYWELTIKKWIRWALNNHVNPDRLFKIGKMSLLLWDRRKIDSITREGN